ncbi:kinase-like domain-containing protein [Polychytrium aggregatum]|uniref:kinase-like domain-containing protein n=1 Tax=Polychytrium aggregatum TaxID=110093 RepID=UPI0022FF08AC|nr:kinase-like domain-containing protein [Polychytrium aggregatum]KAI9207405.1 kinase-like domain-containing protein [Polychytrium aggregatum]
MSSRLDSSPEPSCKRPRRLTLGVSINFPTRPAPTFNDGEFELTNQESFRFKLRHHLLHRVGDLGSGSGGSVYKVQHIHSGTIMARKIVTITIEDASQAERTQARVLRELRILRKCQSPHIVKFFGSFVHEGEISICMEYMDLGSFDRIYTAIGPLDERIVSKVAFAALEGLIYLSEEHNIVHRDMKPSNILLNTDGEVKIADFGVSKELINGTMARTFLGTQRYLPPERVTGGQEHSVKSDIWSLGLTLMELATGRFPFPPEDHPPLPSIVDLLSYIEAEPAPRLPGDLFSTNFDVFCQRCLLKDPEERASLRQLKAEPFASNGASVDLRPWCQQLKARFDFA